MIDDNLQLQCPHCQSKLGVDDTGDLFVLETPSLPDGHNRGLGGLKVIEADPTWARFDGLHNTQQPKPKRHFDKAPTLGNYPERSEPEPAVEAANENDLKDRGLTQ
jgi:hypothetical protein